MVKCILAVIVLILALPQAAQAAMAEGELYAAVLGKAGEREPVEMFTDGGASYKLVSAIKENQVVTALTSRDGKSGVGYTLVQFDCDKKVYREIGYKSGTHVGMEFYSPTKWTGLMDGSSKTNTAIFVCLLQPEGWDFR